MFDRVSEILKFKKISASQFADEIGVQRSSVSHVLSGRNKPGLDFLKKILTSYPEIDPGWLLTGKGDMLVKSEENSGRTGSNGKTYQTSIDMDDDAGSVKSREKSPPGRTGKLPQRQIKTSGDASGIERIVIFYEDGTFSGYRPAGND